MIRTIRRQGTQRQAAIRRQLEQVRAGIGSWYSETTAKAESEYSAFDLGRRVSAIARQPYSIAQRVVGGMRESVKRTIIMNEEIQREMAKAYGIEYADLHAMINRMAEQVERKQGAIEVEAEIVDDAQAEWDGLVAAALLLTDGRGRDGSRLLLEEWGSGERPVVIPTPSIEWPQSGAMPMSGESGWMPMLSAYSVIVPVDPTPESMQSLPHDAQAVMTLPQSSEAAERPAERSTDASSAAPSFAQIEKARYERIKAEGKALEAIEQAEAEAEAKRQRKQARADARAEAARRRKLPIPAQRMLAVSELVSVGDRSFWHNTPTKTRKSAAKMAELVADIPAGEFAAVDELRLALSRMLDRDDDGMMKRARWIPERAAVAQAAVDSALSA